MKKLHAGGRWLVAAVLFVGFLVELAVDVTGLGLHQWLGIAMAGLAGYHLLLHRDWVASVTRRFAGKLGGRARTLYVVDACLLLGFAGITVTGLAMSSWLNLPLVNYSVWRATHVALSLAALWLIVVKVALHLRWIVDVAGRRLLPTPWAPNPVPLRAHTLISRSRRDAIRVMGSVGTLAALASAWVLADEAGVALAGVVPPGPSTEATRESAGDGTGPEAVAALTTDVIEPVLGEADAAANGEPAVAATEDSEPQAPVATGTATSEPATAAPSGQATACTVRCNRGCSYPGHCRKYVDGNGNGFCDLGECV